MKTEGSILLVSLALLFAIQGTRTKNPLAQPSAQFTRVDRTGDDKWRSFFIFSTSDRRYTIRGDGLAESAFGATRPQNFHLSMGRSGHLDRVYFFEDEGDLLLIYEVSDQKYGWGYVERFDQKKLKPKWVAPVSGFNLGPALVEFPYVYFSAANLLAKIDLRTGGYVWKQENFQSPSATPFDGFQLPSISGDRVVFPEDAVQPRLIQLDKTTGRTIVAE